MTDVLSALIAYLKADAEVAALVGARVYGGELPEADVASMPRKCVIVRLAGGTERARSARIARVRADIFSYGEGYKEAGQVDGAVTDALADLRRSTYSSTLLQASGYGGPFQLKEPMHGWKYIARTALVAFDERTAAT